MKKSAPVVFETIGDPASQIERLLQDEPSVFNGTVNVERFRVTIERIEEPEDVLKGRLNDLLNQRGHIDKNKHVRKAAAQLGITLD